MLNLLKIAWFGILIWVVFEIGSIILYNLTDLQLWAKVVILSSLVAYAMNSFPKSNQKRIEELVRAVGIEPVLAHINSILHQQKTAQGLTE